MQPPVKRRAVGIVRVSQLSEDSVSPGEQRDRIIAACERDGLTLLRVHEELDVSGGAPLAKRPGLSAAVEAVEDGEADVIVAAYFDRLIRSLKVQSELIERVEAAGGQVMAVDVGQVTGANAGQWLSGTMLGAVAEYHRRSTAERTAEAQARAVARGVAPWTPLGYLRQEDGTLRVDPSTAPLVRKLYEMRVDGVSIAKLREHLAGNGVAVSHSSVRTLLRTRMVLGEIHWGEHENLTAHESIVDADLWRQVQRTRTPRGRRGKSDLLLARLGVLRCGTCGSRMVAGVQTVGAEKRYPQYRCHANSDCPRKMVISSDTVDDVVSRAVRERIAHKKGRASAEQEAREVVAQRDRAQANLGAALRTFEGLEDEAGARERLLELRQARDEWQAKVDQLGGESAAKTISATIGWDRATLDERRDLIRAVVGRVTVSPGRGAERISVEFLGE